MANRKTNVAAGIFMLLHLITFIAFNAWGKVELNQEYKGLFILYLGSVALLSILYFVKCFAGAQIVCLVAAGALIAIGVQNFLKIDDINKIFFSAYELERKIALYSLSAFAAVSGLAFLFMCISLGINRKRLSSTGFVFMPVIFSLIGGIPWVIENIRALVSEKEAIKIFGGVYDKDTYLIFNIFLAVFALTFIIFIIIGSCCYKFKGRKVNNYVPLDNFDINAEEDKGPGAYNGGFYTPFSGRETQPMQTFYEPKYDEPAEKKVDATAFSNNNIYENESNFTATKDNYVAHEFNVSSPNATEVLKPKETEVSNDVATTIEAGATPAVEQEVTPVAMPAVEQEVTPVEVPDAEQKITPVAMPAVEPITIPKVTPISTPVSDNVTIESSPVENASTQTATEETVATPKVVVQERTSFLDNIF